MVEKGNSMPVIGNGSGANSRKGIDFADMWHMMPLACILVDETLHVTDCNQEALRLWGCSSREAFRRHYINFIPDVQPDGTNSIQKMRMFLEKALATGSASGEFSYRLLSGERMPVELTAARLSRQEQTCLAVFIQDLRPKRKTEEINRLLEMFHTIAQDLLHADDAFDGALTGALATLGRAVSADRVTLWKSFEKHGKRCSRMIYQWSKSPPPRNSEDTGLTLEYDQTPHWKGRMLAGQVLNGPVASLPAEERTLLARRQVLSVLAIPLSEKSFKGFIQLDDVHRVRTFSEMEVRALVSGGRLIASAIAHNESAEMLRKARDAALVATHEKSEFLSRMSHEMRTPLNTIIGLSTIARRTNDLDKLKECFQSMDAACRQLLNIINVVLDIGKIENGKFELSVNEIDLEKVLENAIAVMGVRMEQKRQELHLELEDIFTHRLKKRRVSPHPGGAQSARQRQQIYSGARLRYVEGI
ncbi:MAG TPA: PAS domain S-box protein [Clostridiales bacterium]|nr:PAS domain S-box protein [Clostridiales bacterium]